MDEGARSVATATSMMRRLGLSLILIGGLLALSCSSPAPATPDQGAEEEPEEAVEETDTATDEASGAPAEWAADGVIGPGEYSETLDQGTYKLYWYSTESTIRVAMQATTEGWVALGLQPGERMKDSDIILGLVVDGEILLLDSYSSGDFGPHKADSEFGGTDDIVVFGGSESGGSTTVEFERALDTGDSYDVALERGQKMGIIWAYGSTDDEGQRHSTRGYGEMVP